MIPSSSSNASNSNKKYIGVTEKKPGRWIARVCVPKFAETRVSDCPNQIWLGTYDSSEKGARAYDAASVCIFGPEPNVLLHLNFPDSPPEIPYPDGQLLTVSQVKDEARRHANGASTEPVQPAQDTLEPSDTREVAKEKETIGIAMDALAVPVSARPAGKTHCDFMQVEESAPVPEVVDHTSNEKKVEKEKEIDGSAMDALALPVSARPAGKTCYDFIQVEELKPVPKVLHNAEEEDGDFSP